MNNAAVLRAFVALLPLAAAPLGCKPDPATQRTAPPPSGNTPTTRGSSPSAAREASNAPVTVPMQIGRETFHLEIADSDAEQKRGLMFRESMPADHGMIFVNEDEAERSFWMEATLIPLDILYLDASGRVISIKPMKPRDRSSVPSDGPAMYAIELNRGAAARTGVAVGDRLAIPDNLRELGRSN